MTNRVSRASPNRVGLAALAAEPAVCICALLAAIYGWILFSPDLKVTLWPDSVAYLLPAADAIERGYFSHAGSRGFTYPAMLWLLLEVTDGPWIISAAQRLLAFGTYLCLAGIMIVVGWRLAGTHVHGRRLTAKVTGFWLAVHVFYPPSAGLTHAVAPETLASLLLAVTLGAAVLLAWSASAVHVAVLTSVAVLSSAALALVRPHWQLAACVMVVALPWVAPVARRGFSATVTVAAVSVAGLLFGLPEYLLQKRYDEYLSRTVGPRHLFCSSADIVHEHLTRMGAADQFSVTVRDSLGRILTPLARAQAVDWTLLGFNSDQCTHGETARIVAQHFDWDPAAESRYYISTYLDAVGSRPAYLPIRLARHFGALAWQPFPAVATDYWVHNDDRVLMASAPSRPLFATWAERYRSLFSSDVDIRPWQWLFALRVFFRGAGLLLLLVVAIAMLPCTVLWVTGRRPALSRAFVLVLLCAIATNALIATVHTFEPRYLAMQSPMFVLIGWLGTNFLLGVTLLPDWCLRRANGHTLWNAPGPGSAVLSIARTSRAPFAEAMG